MYFAKIGLDSNSSTFLRFENHFYNMMPVLTLIKETGVGEKPG